MAYTHQQMRVRRDASPVGWIFGAIVALVALVASLPLSTGSQVPTTPPSTPTLYYVRATPTAAASAEDIRAAWLATAYPERAESADCIDWNQVTALMQGQTVCVRGIITDFTQSRQAGLRYRFTDVQSRFFLYSAQWELYDRRTGKTIAPGTCIDVTGTIRVQSGVPYMNLDEMIGGDPIDEFNFYDSTSPCE